MKRALLPLVAASTAAIAACSAGPRPAAQPDGVAPLIVVTPTEPREQTADQQVQHVLNRLAFGARPGDVQKVREMGVDKWIALQLAPDRIADTAADRVVASYEMLGKPTADLAVSMYDAGQIAVRRLQKTEAQQGDTGAKRDLRQEALRNDPKLREQLRQNQRILGDLQSSRLARAVVSERQLDEVMTDFWENHFSIFAGKGTDRIYLPAFDRDVIRPNAMGHFRDLLGAVAKSPAMLFYLDQWQSAADSAHPTLAAGRVQRPGPGAGRLLGNGVTMEQIERLPQFAQMTADQRKQLEAMTPQQRAQFLQQRAQGAQARRGLNENYARELMELHTLGVDGGYTQHDVIEVARALTGWTMNPRQRAEFVFRPEIHDAGQKVVLGHVLPAGRGQQDGEDVLDMLAKNPHTAHYIALKLATRFVSDEPPAELVDRAAQVFLATDGNIREVVRSIVTSSEFFSRSAYRAKVKSPFELVASAERALGAQADTTLRSVQMLAYLGQPMFGHQAPNGWPEKGDEWMNSGAILNRINFGISLAAGRFPGATLANWPDAARLRAATRDQHVEAFVQAFLGGQASPDTRDILANGENPLVAKLASTVKADSSAAAMDAMGDQSSMQAPPLRERPNAVAKNGQVRPGPARQMGGQAPVQLNGLAQVVGLAIGAPEFQRR